MSDPQDDGAHEVLEVSALAAAPAELPAELPPEIPPEIPIEPRSDLPSAAPPAPAGEETSSAPLGNTVVLERRRSPRQQALRAASALLLVALFLLPVFLALNGNGAAVLRVLSPPTPLLQAGADAFLWEHTVPWGSLLIDGVPGPDVGGSAVRQVGGFAEGVVFHLGRGRHTLTYQAAPFPTLICTVSVPASLDDTCPLDREKDYAYLVQAQPAARLLDLQATINHLPSVTRQALLAQTQDMLTALATGLPPAMVAVGDHYQNADGQIRQATRPLVLTPHYQLGPEIPQVDTRLCVTLCASTGLGENVSTPGWTLLAPVLMTWRYTAAGGQLILADGPASPPGASPTSVIPVQTRWTNGRWDTPSVVPGPLGADPMICRIATQALETVQTLSGTSGYEWSTIRSTAELGCMLAGRDDTQTSDRPSSSLALALYRAGVLIAVNDQAKQVLPVWPSASAHERALALAVAPLDRS